MQADLPDNIRRIALENGFERCHFSRPKLGEKHHAALDDWLEQGMQGDMAWMAEKSRVLRRKHPESMLEDVRTVISVAMRYSPPTYTLNAAIITQDRGVISAYAHGDDYHEVMKKRLKALARDLDALLGPHEQRVYVDTAPVLEHAMAENSGLGWQGKHSLTLNRQLGSWFFLGELFTTAEIEVDEKASFHCGTCTACINACPTGAIVAPFVVDARLCISYLTIEHKGLIPRELRPLMGNRIYGCDDCQLVCPWNSEIEAPGKDLLAPRGENYLPELAMLLKLDEAGFRESFRKSPVKRIGRVALHRNVCIAMGNSGDKGFVPLLIKALDDAAAMVRAHAAWALARLAPEDERIHEVISQTMDKELDQQAYEDMRLTLKEKE